MESTVPGNVAQGVFERACLQETPSNPWLLNSCKNCEYPRAATGADLASTNANVFRPEIGPLCWAESETDDNIVDRHWSPPQTTCCRSRQLHHCPESRNRVVSRKTSTPTTATHPTLPITRNTPISLPRDQEISLLSFA